MHGALSASLGGTTAGRHEAVGKLFGMYSLHEAARWDTDCVKYLHLQRHQHTVCCCCCCAGCTLDTPHRSWHLLWGPVQAVHLLLGHRSRCTFAQGGQTQQTVQLCVLVSACSRLICYSYL